MQRVIEIERSAELCAESGWYAYIFTLSEPLDAALADRIAALGSAMLLRQLARPFLTVRTEHMVLRGIFGDSTLRVGVPALDAPELRRVEEIINNQGSTA